LTLRVAVGALTAVCATAAFAGAAVAEQVVITNGYGRCLDAQLQSMAAVPTTVQLYNCRGGAPLNQQ
jgi:hypothetical protein